MLRLNVAAKCWHHILTFHQPLQPQLLEVEKPEMPIDHRRAALAALNKWAHESRLDSE